MSIINFFIVFGVSAFKFIFGPAIGFSFKLPYIFTVVATFTGMMLSVMVFALVGERMRVYLLNRFYPNRKIFTKRTRQRIKFWKKYGLFGVAFLTPVLFSPVVGTLITVSFGEKWLKIVFAMLLSSVFWAFTVSYLVYFVGGIFMH